MPSNVLLVGPQVISVVAGIVVLLAAAFAFAFTHRATARAGHQGHRPAEQAHEGERATPDGFIDSFAGAVSEAGGSLPLMAWVIIGGTLVVYFVYLFINWNPGG